ncbi:hypothetical protein NPX13_g7520 [Xylaria arbuscula]|uniref:Uncharacterized protein n=1 Tax=Xylaria arbuscula TaxID=114810 RepID=A0A9W8NAC0_9PEZI|nr:hypothetical protein NPX13_g7520 [Xylaria arbuscula]
MKKHLLVTLALSVAHAYAQELNQTVVGCVELDCPPSADAVNDNCTVAGLSFPSVGLTRIPTDNAGLKDKVSWTKGFQIIDNPDSNRTFHSAFYFGTSPGLDLGDTGACAVLFHGLEAALSFDKVNPNIESAQGTCSDAMGSDCVTALLDRAQKLVDSFGNSASSSEDACAKLKDDLDKNMDNACLSLSKGSWTNLTSAVLSGKGAAQPLSGDKNSSSTCWPVLPKENELTLSSEYKTNGSDLLDEVQAAMYAITPILTLFFPTGDKSVVTTGDASLSCLKVVGPAKASLDTQSDGSQDQHDNGAPTAFSSRSAFSGAVIAVVAAAWLA